MGFSDLSPSPTLPLSQNWERGRVPPQAAGGGEGPASFSLLRLSMRGLEEGGIHAKTTLAPNEFRA